MAFRMMERTKTLMCFDFINELNVHQCFCPFHHLNFIFLMFQLPGGEYCLRAPEHRSTRILTTNYPEHA